MRVAARGDQAQLAPNPKNNAMRPEQTPSHQHDRPRRRWPYRCLTLAEVGEGEQPGALQVTSAILSAQFLRVVPPRGSTDCARQRTHWPARRACSCSRSVRCARPVDELVEKYPHFKGRFLKWQAALRAYFDGTHNQFAPPSQSLGTCSVSIATRPAGSALPRYCS